MSIKEDKSHLRQVSKHDRMRLTSSERDRAEREISRIIIQFCQLHLSRVNDDEDNSQHFARDVVPRARRQPTIALYAATQGEVNLSACFLSLQSAGWRIVFPKVASSSEMDMICVHELSELVDGRFHIPEPPLSNEVVTPDELDYILVPGLRFTTNGVRLGYGGGYYDRYLARCESHVHPVGIAFHCQVCETLPSGQYDKRMRSLITERGVWDCKTGQLQLS